MKTKRSTLPVGTRVLHDRYEVVKLIHAKGMANVYLVIDSSLNKQWCMKEIKKSESGKNFVEYSSLIQEANIMKGLNHSNIPRIVTIEEEGDSVFIIMDYVDGMSIKDWMNRTKGSGRVPQELAVLWMKQICQVMIYLHNLKYPIFYRDMKPDNVMIQSDGNIKVLDFGISIVIRENGQKIEKALGTKGYAAPEQSKSGNICDLRSDIYSMGKTMYYMLTGLNPSQIPKDRLRPIREIDSSISVGLEKIVDKCCKENPDDRYQSCEELMYALQNYKTLDENYKLKLKKKVYSVSALFVAGIILISSSFIPLNLYRSQIRDQYNTLYTIATQSNRIGDYVAVLDVDATKVEPYLGIIESIKVDGSFTQEEEQMLLNYLNPNISSLRESNGYGELAYNLGKLYWLYYESDIQDEGMVLSVKWFSDSINCGYEVELSNCYYQLGYFKQNIQSAVIESNDMGMYREYWDNLINVKSVDSGEIVRLQVNLAIANCISTYAYNLMMDNVSYDEVSSQIDELNMFVQQYKPTIDRITEKYNTLVSVLNTLQDKVDLVYQEG